MSKINKIYSCKKLNRALKIKLKQQSDQVVPVFVETQEERPLGHFDALPIELKFMVFSYLKGDNSQLKLFIISIKITKRLIF